MLDTWTNSDGWVMFEPHYSTHDKAQVRKEVMDFACPHIRAVLQTAFDNGVEITGYCSDGDPWLKCHHCKQWLGEVGSLWD